MVAFASRQGDHAMKKKSESRTAKKITLKRTRGVVVRTGVRGGYMKLA